MDLLFPSGQKCKFRSETRYQQQQQIVSVLLGASPQDKLQLNLTCDYTD